MNYACFQESRSSWENLIDKRQSRALERADIKAQRRVRDVSAKARRMRLEKEKRQAQNMKHLIKKQELNLLKNLDSIISKVCVFLSLLFGLYQLK